MYGVQGHAENQIALKQSAIKCERERERETKMDI